MTDDYFSSLLRRNEEQRRIQRELEQARRDAKTTFLLMDAARSYIVQAGWILN